MRGLTGRSITEAFAHDDPDCPACAGTGTVCAEHPDVPWDDGSGRGCSCGEAGAPCPVFMASHA